MPGPHHHHGGGGYGWGGGYPRNYAYGLGPAVLAVDPSSDCACKSGTGATGGFEQWVKDNPWFALIGVFALGALVNKKKGIF